MSARVFIYQTLCSTPSIADEVGGLENPRVFAKKSMTSSVEDHPFIVYKLGNATSLNITGEDEDLSEVENQFIQVWVHDYEDKDTADYMRIDRVLLAIKKRLKNAASPADGVYGFQYLETSQDLNDETLNTVFKYARYQLKKNGE